MNKRVQRFLWVLGLVLTFAFLVYVGVQAYSDDFHGGVRVYDPFDIDDGTCPYDTAESVTPCTWIGCAGYEIGYEWVPDADMQITGIELYISAGGSWCSGSDCPNPTQPLSVTLRSGGSLPGIVIGGGEFSPIGIQDSDAWPALSPVTVTFASPVTLTASTTYWLWFVNEDSTQGASYDIWTNQWGAPACDPAFPAWLTSYWVNDDGVYIDYGDLVAMPMALKGSLIGAATPTPTSSPTSAAGGPGGTPVSTPQMTPTAWKRVTIYAMEEATPARRPWLIVGYNP